MRGPLRVHHLIATLDRGGAEQQLTHLLCGLDRERFQPGLSCLVRGGPHEARLKEAEVPVTVLGKRPGFDLALLPRLARHLRELRPDLLHCWLFTANSFGHVAGRLAGVPVLVASERGIEEGKGLRHALADRLVARLSDCIVANSEAGRRLVVERWGADEERSLCIPNGVDLERFRPVDRSGRRGALRVVLLGRLRRQKRVDVFLDALALLRERGFPVEARIFGDGPLRAELEGRLDGLAALAPATAETPRVLQEADVLVSSSDWEGSPNVLLEAMASALPVVATRVRGSSELVKDGATGLLVPRVDAAALAAAIERLGRDPELRLRLGAEGRRAAERSWSIPALVRRHEELYERLAGDRT